MMKQSYLCGNVQLSKDGNSLAHYFENNVVDTPHSRRQVALSDYEWGDLVDDQDQVRLLINPTSTYAQAAAAALGRSMDDVCISAFLGTANTGVAGGTSTR